MLALLLIAASVGLGNFAAAISIGVSGVDARTRLRVGLVFGAFESGMPIVGLLIGNRYATMLGHAARWVGAGLLIAVGLFSLIRSLRENRSGEQRSYSAGGVRLLLSGLALSMDNLVVGFALGTAQTSIALDAIVIGAVSVAMSLIGLEVGSRLGSLAPERGEQAGGAILALVGVALAAGVLT
ncbi:MAG TPA: manganese efflux pump [Streptosporangiaceae bacterium]|jgi:putative Mn2+ efflux pump MntP